MARLTDYLSSLDPLDAQKLQGKQRITEIKYDTIVLPAGWRNVTSGAQGEAARYESDVAELREGQVLWGWPHSVQDEKITQIAEATARARVWTTPTLTLFKFAFALGQSDAEIRSRPEWSIMPPKHRALREVKQLGGSSRRPGSRSDPRSGFASADVTATRARSWLGFLVRRRSRAIDARKLVNERCSISTPLGRPVEPEVKST